MTSASAHKSLGGGAEAADKKLVSKQQQMVIARVTRPRRLNFNLFHSMGLDCYHPPSRPFCKLKETMFAWKMSFLLSS
jgi:hypothetical protein